MQRGCRLLTAEIRLAQDFVKPKDSNLQTSDIPGAQVSHGRQTICLSNSSPPPAIQFMEHDAQVDANRCASLSIIGRKMGVANNVLICLFTYEDAKTAAGIANE
jgi:hypothetical protein